MQSQTIVMDESGDIDIRTVDVPDIGTDELLVHVELTGICGSDVHMREGGLDLDFPVVPGHELAGIVEEVGENVTTDSAGNRIEPGDGITVVPGVNVVDDWYTNHVPAHPLACTERKVYGFRDIEDEPHIHGGMSEYFIIEKDAHFFRLPDDLDVELGALVEPLAVATHALDLSYQPGIPWIREGFGIGQSVVVQGAGPIGMLTSAAANHAGAGQVISVDLVDERLDLATRFGATHTVNVGDYEDETFIDAIDEMTPSGDGPDVVIEAVGHPTAFEQAIDISRKAGTVVEVGHYASNGEAEIDPSQLIHKELSIRGSLAYPPSQFETAISLLNQTSENLPFRELFNHRVSLDEAESAYEAQAAGEAYRATVHPNR
ncbi:zinc-dependent alcohol dehydrogenase [Haladaptatus salinisoli]|uniref:zinc-dependent alcohol dehydrogenase n=1 Tax=Haladaptatus salinisoli TaxID=2884876 RepID=UPI001D0A1F90|nr:zinc-binding dehydrogenase [Haladaptatus salinisoli]